MRDRDGFGLLETLIALSLTTIALWSGLALITAQVRHSKFVEIRGEVEDARQTIRLHVDWNTMAPRLLATAAGEFIEVTARPPAPAILIARADVSPPTQLHRGFFVRARVNQKKCLDIEYRRAGGSALGAFSRKLANSDEWLALFKPQGLCAADIPQGAKGDPSTVDLASICLSFQGRYFAESSRCVLGLPSGQLSFKGFHDRTGVETDENIAACDSYGGKVEACKRIARVNKSGNLKGGTCYWREKRDATGELQKFGGGPRKGEDMAGFYRKGSGWCEGGVYIDSNPPDPAYEDDTDAG